MTDEPKKLTGVQKLLRALNYWSQGWGGLSLFIAVATGGTTIVQLFMFWVVGCLVILAAALLWALGYGIFEIICYIYRCFYSVCSGTYRFTVWLIVSLIKAPFKLAVSLFNIALYFIAPFSAYLPWKWGKFLEVWHLDKWYRDSIRSIDKSQIGDEAKPFAKEVQRQLYGKKLEEIWK